MSIILASSSPRRQELLQQLGLTFTVLSPDIDESKQAGESAADYVLRMAQEKAAAVAQSLTNNDVVIAADTAVVYGEQLLGKPADAEEAYAILSQLSGKTHQVLTGLCCQRGAQIETVVSQTQVTFRTLSEQAIKSYWQTGEPQDKAGAYGIQGKAALFVEKITGSYSAVVGLPLCELGRLMQRFGIDLLNYSQHSFSHD